MGGPGPKEARRLTGEFGDHVGVLHDLVVYLARSGCTGYAVGALSVHAQRKMLRAMVGDFEQRISRQFLRQARVTGNPSSVEEQSGRYLVLAQEIQDRVVGLASSRPSA